MPVFAKATKENGESKRKFASENEDDCGDLMREQNGHVHNGEGENFAALKKCMREVTHQIPPPDHNMIYRVILQDSLG